MSQPQTHGRAVGRVAIDALSQGAGGGLSVARNLTRAMAIERPEAHFDLYCASSQLANADFSDNVAVIHRPEGAGLLGRLRFEQLELPRRLAGNGTDGVLNLGGFAIFRCPVPQISVWQNANITTRVAIPRPLWMNSYIAVQRWIQAATMPRVALNLFPTQSALDEAASRFELRDVATGVIPFGIETPPAVSAPLELEVKGPIVSSVGDSYFHKNHEAMIDALARYRERYGEAPHLIIAGGGVETRYHATLVQRVRERGLEDRVQFVGRKSPAEIGGLYARSRAYLVTSRLESFGLTPLEAMAAGVPVVAGRTSSLPEVCGEAAHYCDPNDPEDIAEKLHEVLEDSSLRERLVACGRERVESFTWERCGRSFLAALDRSLAAVGRTQEAAS